MVIKSEEYRRFLEDSYFVYLKQGSPKYFEDYPLSVELYLYPPSNKAFDTDNRIKPVQDALQHVGFYQNDSIIKRVTAEACFPVEGGAVVIVVDYFKACSKSDELAKWFKLRPLKPKRSAKK